MLFGPMQIPLFECIGLQASWLKTIIKGRNWLVVYVKNVKDYLITVIGYNTSLLHTWWTGGEERYLTKSGI